MRRSTLVFCCMSVFALAGIPEPPTLVYGKVLVRAGGREMLVTSGKLAWSIAPVGDASQAVSLEAGLRSHDDVYSYLLRIPHEAKVIDADVAGAQVALKSAQVVHQLLTVTVDGVAATVLDPSAALLALSQADRTRAHRVDLLLGTDMPDTDGDGMPDWWETQLGLDPDSDDANADPDGDGLSNGAEFALGTDPGADNRIPTLLDSSVTVFEGATTVLPLRVVDVDSPLDRVVYTVLELPQSGTLVKSGAELAVDGTFTQNDVVNGAVAFVHPAGDPLRQTLRVSLHDEATALTPREYTLTLAGYQPEEWSQVAPQDLNTALRQTCDVADRADVLAYLAGKWFGMSVWDNAGAASDVDCSAPSACAMVGSDAADVLIGSTAADLIIGGKGDDRLAGGQGADVFVLDPSSGNDTVADFSISQGDRLDLCALLGGASDSIVDYLRVSTVGNDVLLSFDINGDGSGFGDMVLTLANAAGTFDFDRAYAAGLILTNGLNQPVTVNVLVADGDSRASETDGQQATFTLRRTGPLGSALTVSLSLSGSATNGTDYDFIPSQATFPAGSATLAVPVVPVTDYTVEGTETVVLSVQNGNSYELGGKPSAQVTIADLAERVSLTAVEPLAIKDGQAATVMIKRTGVITRQTTVWLTISGSATNGSNVDTLPNRVILAAGETAQYLDIVVRPGAQLANGVERVVLTIRNDPAGVYERAPDSSVTVVVIDSAEFATDINRDGVLDAEDPDGDAIATADEQALGADPQSPTLLLQPGWNLISVPTGADTQADQLGADFAGAVWAWNGTTYETVTDALEPGRGYFVFAFAETAIDLPAAPRGNGRVTCSEGWNLIGPIGGGYLGEDTAGFLVVYGFDGQIYRRVEDAVLRPMKGYWAFRMASAEVILP